MDDEVSQTKYIRGHSCALIEGFEKIAVEQYIIEGFSGWYWRQDKQMNQILYCPYCGERLIDD